MARSNNGFEDRWLDREDLIKRDRAMGVHDSRQLCMLRWMQYHNWDVIGPPLNRLDSYKPRRRNLPIRITLPSIPYHGRKTKTMIKKGLRKTNETQEFPVVAFSVCFAEDDGLPFFVSFLSLSYLVGLSCRRLVLGLVWFLCSLESQT